ncbi:hypothetical protein KR093_006020 [Drosophila rubida]|uniref:Uncharacterized protein n=1 Tax=Drosophila rubida TaxID=30044 RepID=A0AAD4PRR9_9MUSC|nr:hypothetical protein KR093_006020 [Drosophila rubida]
MQSTPTRFFGCLWKQTAMQHLATMGRQLQLQKFATRHMASKGGNWSDRDDGDRNRTTMMTQRDGPSRPIMRETNMWKDPQRLDTKWLRARDPRRYRPDFGQTEPHSLRKQFMRSPDERTRDAMSRDWEAALQMNERSRRQTQLVVQKRNHDKMFKQLSRNESGRRSRSKYATKKRHQSESKSRQAGRRASDD